MPRVIGTSVHLHPVVVVCGVVVGASVGGILGAFLAAPVIASLRLIGGYTHAKLLNYPPSAHATRSHNRSAPASIDGWSFRMQSRRTQGAPRSQELNWKKTRTRTPLLRLPIHPQAVKRNAGEMLAPQVVHSYRASVRGKFAYTSRARASRVGGSADCSRCVERATAWLYARL